MISQSDTYFQMINAVEWRDFSMNIRNVNRDDNFPFLNGFPFFIGRLGQSCDLRRSGEKFFLIWGG